MNFDLGYNNVSYMLRSRLTIDQRDNICTVCEKPYTHRRRFDWGNDSSIKDVSFITAHACCRGWIEKKQKLEMQLNECNWQIFRLKNLVA